jgi:hypothetical protein
MKLQRLFGCVAEQASAGPCRDRMVDRPAAMIGASTHFEVAIVRAAMLFGLSSGAALGTEWRGCSSRCR